MSKKPDVLSAPDKLAELVEQGLSLNRMDFLYDQLRLVGSVMGLRALVEVVTFGDNESARVSAAKMLMDLREDPQDIVDRLKAAPFADLSMDQLEHVLDRFGGGETDLKKLIDEARGMAPTKQE
jgi:hypothetical protein